MMIVEESYLRSGDKDYLNENSHCATNYPYTCYAGPVVCCINLLFGKSSPNKTSVCEKGEERAVTEPPLNLLHSYTER